MYNNYYIFIVIFSSKFSDSTKGFVYLQECMGSTTQMIHTNLVKEARYFYMISVNSLKFPFYQRSSTSEYFGQVGYRSVVFF